MNDSETIPSVLPAIAQKDLDAAGFPTSAPMAPGLAVFFNDALYARCSTLARIMSKGEGVIPRHLIGKPEACFAIVSRAITWNLDVYAVAMCTYQTPGGAIGFEGKLCQAILENSGKLEGGVEFQEVGDWSKVKGKFKLMEGKNGNKYPVPTWTREDAAGLRVIVSAQIKGEKKPRSLTFDLDSAFPLNSPLWATAPERQVRYTAVRAFANQAMPGVMMGIPFDTDPTGFYGEPMTNITPARPTKANGEFDRSDMGNTEKSKDEVPPVTATKTEETQPAKTSKAKEPTPEPPKEEPAKEGPRPTPPQEASEPAKAEPSSPPAPEAAAPTTPEDPVMAEWYQKQIALAKASESVAELMDLRNVVQENMDDGICVEFRKMLAPMVTAIIKKELAACAGVKQVTALRKGADGKDGYEKILQGEMLTWFAGQADERQRAILAAPSKKK